MKLIKITLISFSLFISALSWGYCDGTNDDFKSGSQSLSPEQLDGLRYSPGNDYLTLIDSYKKLSQYSVSAIGHALKTNQQGAYLNLSQDDIDIQRVFPVFIKSFKCVSKENDEKGVIDAHAFGSGAITYLPKKTIASLLGDIEHWSKQVGLNLI